MPGMVSRVAATALRVGVRSSLKTGLKIRGTATHDALIADGLGQLPGAVDVVVLAQASMERVADTLSAEDRGAPILSSPRSGVERARTVLLGAAATEPTSPAYRAPAH